MAVRSLTPDSSTSTMAAIWVGMSMKTTRQAVHLAARITAAAAGNEIWVSCVLPGLFVGSDLHFDSREMHELNGFPSAVELWSIQTELPRSPIMTDGFMSKR